MARDIGDYLDLTMEDAVAQWRRILAREPRKRQERYLPVEVLLCHAMFYEVNPHRWGGANIHKAPPIVHQVARLTLRTPGSITNKMLNLDGSRPNAGPFEWRVFKALTEAPDLHAALYTTVLGAARVCGIDEEALPDFLGCLGADRVRLIGQDEIESHALSRLIEAELPELQAQLGAGELETSRLVEYRARVGQHRFARQVLHNCGNRCVFCGFNAEELGGHRLLIASHIKPWAASTNRERLDVTNGIAACPTHDAAFDGGLLTINGGLRIHRAPHLTEQTRRDASVARYFDAPALLPRARFPEGSRAPGPKYLRFHKREIFQAVA